MRRPDARECHFSYHPVANQLLGQGEIAEQHVRGSNDHDELATLGQGAEDIGFLHSGRNGFLGHEMLAGLENRERRLIVRRNRREVDDRVEVDLLKHRIHARKHRGDTEIGGDFASAFDARGSDCYELGLVCDWAEIWEDAIVDCGYHACAGEPQPNLSAAFVGLVHGAGPSFTRTRRPDWAAS